MSSNIDEIKKLKKLLDDGIITEEDFNKQKKRILGSSKETKLSNTESENKKKSLDDYEAELISQIAEENDSVDDNTENISESDKIYNEEKAKEKARLDALSEKKRERNAEINKIVDKGISKGMRIFKWILAVFCWLMTLGCFGTIADNPAMYVISAFGFMALGLMACPKITDLTQKKFIVYSQHKTLIVWIVVIITCASLVIFS